MAEPNLTLEILAKGVETLPENPVILGRLIDLLFDLERGEEAIPSIEAMRAARGGRQPGRGMGGCPPSHGTPAVAPGPGEA